jgi:ribose transport system permease protein
MSPATRLSGPSPNGAAMSAETDAAPPAAGDPAGPPAEPTGRSLPRWVALLSIKRISAVYLWIAFMVLFTILKPDTFLTATTFKVVFSEGVITCVLALAFLVPLAAGVYDLSIGAVLSLSLAISVYLQMHTGLPPVAGAVIAVAASAVSGALSGFVVVRLRVDSFIATLGVSQVLLAAVLLISNNQQMVADFPDSWSNLGNNNVFGVPVVVLYLLVISAVIWYVLEFTRVGRYLFATGGNAEAARLSGVRTDRMVWGSLIASGTIAGVAGVIYSMRSGLYSTATGPGYLFPAVAAVFLGASQFQQRPNVWGTLIAYFALAFGIQGLALSSSSGAVWSQPLFEGFALIIAVAFASRPVVAKLRQRTPAAGAAPGESAAATGAEA